MKSLIKKSSLLIVTLFMFTTVAALNAQDTLNVQDEGSDIFSLLQERSDLSTFTEIVQAAQLESAFQSEGEYTVFAVTNEAFDALDSSYLEQLKSDPTAAQEFVTSYFVQGKVSMEQVTSENIGSASIVEGDIPASNGVIHIIDGVKEAPQMETETEDEY